MAKRVFISTMVMKGMLSNYGTFMQHYALRTITASLGYVPVRWTTISENPNLIGWLLEILAELMRIPYWFVTRIPHYKNHIRQQIPNLRIKSKFRYDYRKVVAPFYEDNTVKSDDILLMGSDQVMMLIRGAWYVDAPADNKRIIYAGSTDWTEFPACPEWRELASAELPRFKHISLREKEGVEICSKFLPLGHEPIAHVVDPVVLAGAPIFDKISSSRLMFNRPTLFVYMVNIRSESELNLAALEATAKGLGCDLKVLGIQGVNCYLPSCYRLIASPTEFVACYRDAAYVVTNSFHGLVFASLYHKSFAFLKQAVLNGTDQNLRQTEYLSMIGCAQRGLENDASLGEILNALKSQPNWTDVDGRIELKRKASLDWLRKALND